jgi:hypothetical protein
MNENPLDLKRGAERNAAIVEAIVADRLKLAHLLRCVEQGCAGNPCKYCGTERPVEQAHA